MATVSVANTDSGLSGKTIDLLESDQTITGLKTFSRGAQSPFAVAVGSTKVSNLDADLLDGVEAAAFYKIDGSVTLTAGISFPAVQVPSAGANILDDYEEGNWTPTIGGTGGQSGQTYTTQVGRYVKVGKLVHVQGYIVLSAKGTITTSAQIQGFPFTALSTANTWGTMNIQWFGFTSSFVAMSVEVIPNTTAFTLFGLTAAGTTLVALVQADLANASQLIFSGTYIADA